MKRPRAKYPGPPRAAWQSSSAAVLLAASLVGCASATHSAPAESPTASIAAIDPCADIDLRLPDGRELDLTGTWRGMLNGEYFLSQHGACLFWMGRSASADKVPAGNYFTNVFDGRIESDSTVTGQWSDVPAQPDASANYGVLRLAIDSFTFDGRTWPALRLQSQYPFDVYADTRWQPEETLGSVATYVGVVGIDSGTCPWLDAEGVRYELSGPVFVEGTHVVTPDGEGASAGDQVRVEARMAQMLGGGGCGSNVLLVSDLAPTP